MTYRKFLIEEELVYVHEEDIKLYLAFPQVYYHIQGKLYAYNARIFLDNEGNICNDDICSLRLPIELLDHEGNELDFEDFEFDLDSIEGFIHNNKLYFLDFFGEVL